METNEIMNNDEVIETTEEIIKTASKSRLSKFATIGAAMIAGGLAYKYIVAPTVKKIKSIKERKGFRAIEGEVINKNMESVDEDDVED